MYYIAYGSNLNYEQMAYRCPHSKPVCKGMLNNYRLVFNIHADVIPEKGAETPVLLWDIAEEDWRSLDRYEGYPKYYVKEVVDVETDMGIVPCIVYVMAEDRKGFALPYSDYYNIIKDGYTENNMPKAYLREALEYSYDREATNFYCEEEDETY